MKNRFITCSIMFLTCIFSLNNCKNVNNSNENDKIIYVGSDILSPFFIEDGDGYFTGVDVILATEAFQRLGYKAIFKQIEWDDKNNYLKNKEIDCLWGSFTMTGRENEYLWAGPYMNSRQIIAVKKNSNIYTFADLKDKRIGVQITTKPDTIFSNNSDPRIPQIRRLYCFSKMDYVFTALRNGYVDAIAGHETPYLDFINNSSNDGEYRILDETLLEGKIGVAFSKDYDTSFVSSLTNALISMKKDGFITSLLTQYKIDASKALDGVLNEN